MATLKMIAASLGLDISTVSYALNGKGERMGIPAERIEEIKRAAAAVNYRPNMAARIVRSGRFGNVALLLSHVWYVSNVPSGLLEGVEHSLEAIDLRMMIARLPDADPANVERVPMILRELATDGLLVDYGDIVPPHIRELVLRCNLPCIWINCKYEHDCVYPDEYPAARSAAEQLLAMGHRRIAYSYYNWSLADVSLAHFSARERLAGCTDALAAAGLKPMPGAVKPADDSPNQFDDILAAAMTCLSQPNRPTAIVAYSSFDAIAFVAAAYRLGLSVPADLSVLAFQDQVLYAIDKPLATVLIPQREIGRAAVATLRQKIGAPALHLPPVAVPMVFEPGATLAPPSRNA